MAKIITTSSHDQDFLIKGKGAKGRVDAYPLQTSSLSITLKQKV